MNFILQILYLGFFILGIYAYVKNWFVEKPISESTTNWIIICSIMSMFFLAAAKGLYDMNGVVYYIIIIQALLRTFLCISFFILLTTFSYYYWNKSSKFYRSYVDNSYDMYLIHMPIIVTIQYILLFVNMSIFIKFGVVVLLSFFSCYWICNVLVRPRPKTAIVVLLIVFAISAIFITPSW